MLKIAHIADVHFRSLSRHDEYKEVFEYFANDCEEKGVDHIVVCGDIFHTKTTGLSPEYIDVLTWWMKRLSSVATLHLTLGNHDGNLTNLQRQDAVTPIYEAIRNNQDLKNPIYLYKNSGIYPVTPEHNLCVFSLFDEEGWKNVKPEPGKYNMAVYHGSVDAALTETGWVLKSHVTVEDFKDYDIVLLGDIHRTQFLAYRKFGDKEIPWIGYPGSTLQQNYAEALDHGYFLWSILDKEHEVSFVKLPNPKPYMTIDWMPELSEYDLPKFSRVRIRHKRPLTQLEIKNSIKFLQDKFSATEVIFNLDSKAHAKELIEKIPVIKDNFRNIDSLTQMLKDFDTKRNFGDEEWKSVQELLSQYMKEVQDGSLARNVKWSLKELKWDNLFGYGPDNKINFDTLNGIVGVFGPNRVGKSSIIGSLMYCLFNGSDRGSLKNLEMINVRKSHSYARAVLGLNGEDYVIERQTTKNTTKKELTASTAVNIFKMSGEEAVELNGEARSDTDKIIKSLIGNADDFMLMSLSTQGDIDRFIKEGSAHRKQILTRFLDLDFFDRIHDLAKTNVNSLKTEAKVIQSVKTLDISFLNSNQEEIEDRLSSLDNLRKDILAEVQKLSGKVKTSGLQDLNNSLNKKELEQNKASSTIFSLRQDRDKFENEIESARFQKEKCHEEFKNLDMQSLKERYSKLKELKQTIVSAQHTFEKRDAELKRKIKSVKVLAEVPCGDSFPNCKFIKEAHVDKSDIDISMKELSVSSEQLSKITNELQEIESTGLENAIRRADEIKIELRNVEGNIHRLQLEILDKNSKLQILEPQENDLAVEVQELKKKIGEVSSTSIKNSINILEDRQNKLRLLDSEISSLHMKLGTIKEQIRQSEESSIVFNKTMKKLSIAEFIMVSFSKKGIPSKILSQQLPVINTEISNILAGIVNFNVELECNDSSTLDIYVNYGDSKRIIELCSGMEKMISSMAIRVALSNVSTMPKSDIFIVDEGFGALDEANIESCKRLLVSFKKYFKSVLIISHIPSIKDVADMVMEVQRVENDSKMCYG